MTKKTTHSNLSGRLLHTKVKTSRKRSNSSARWLQRQLNDPYVAEAQKLGYKSRAAFKLIQLDEKFHFLKRGQKILDLGCAPGGWVQIAESKGCNVVGIDLLPVDPIGNAVLYQGDFTDPLMQEKILSHFPDKADLVISDMAPDTTGHKQTDHLRIIILLEQVVAFAIEHVKEGGHLIMKTFQGGLETSLLTEIKKHFGKVKHMKPDASRKASNEIYLVAMDFKKTGNIK